MDREGGRPGAGAGGFASFSWDLTRAAGARKEGGKPASNVNFPPSFRALGVIIVQGGDIAGEVLLLICDSDEGVGSRPRNSPFPKKPRTRSVRGLFFLRACVSVFSVKTT